MKDDSHVFSVDGVTAPKLDKQPEETKTELPKSANPIAPSESSARDSSQQAKPKGQTVNLNVKLSIPNYKKFKLPKLPKIGRLSKKQTIITASGILAVTLVVCGLLIANRKTTTKDITAVESASTSQGVSFNPLIPQTATNKVLPRFDSKRNLVSFTDTFKGASLTISQQKAPPSAKDDNNFLNKVAESAPGIKEAVLTTKGNAVVATDPISEQQTVVFVDGEVLVFIRTPKLLQDADWIEYVSKMKAN